MKLEQDKNAKILQRALVHMILAYLYLDCCSGIEESVKDNTQRELIISILEYIEDHMKHWITLNQISESLNYSVGVSVKSIQRQYRTESESVYIKETCR